MPDFVNGESKLKIVLFAIPMHTITRIVVVFFVKDAIGKVIVL
jgi:hypothetical protein